MRTPKIIRFPPAAALVDARPRTLAERLRSDLQHMHERIRQFFRPRKAKVFRINNPAQWKLEQIRRKARGAL